VGAWFDWMNKYNRWQLKVQAKREDNPNGFGRRRLWTDQRLQVWKPLIRPSDRDGGGDGRVDFKPHEKTNTFRAILIHQILSERRFFAQFVGTEEPPVEGLRPAGEHPPVQAYLDQYVWLAKRRLPQFTSASAEWWLEEWPFFGGLKRLRIWTFWRRLLHTCHHRTQVQTWLQLAGR
jgi:hypothetical protein